MTAPSVPGLRDKLADVMPEHQTWCHAIAHGDCCRADDCDCGVTDSLERVAVVVQAAIDDAVTAELEEAAAGFDYTPLSEREAGVVSDYSRGWHNAAQALRARVAARGGEQR